MSTLDIILAIPLVWGLYRGFRNGLFIELAAIVALIAGVYGAIHFSYLVANQLETMVSVNVRYVKLLSFILTLIAIMVLVHFAGKLLTKLADAILLGTLNKIAGAFFGLIKIAVILGAVILFVDRTLSGIGVIKEETKSDSILYEPLKDAGNLIFDLAFGDKDKTKGV